MRFGNAWAALLALFVAAPSLAAVEGSTYFLRQKFPPAVDQTCSQSLTAMSKLLFGEKSENQRLSKYASLRCLEDETRPLSVEVLFEPETEADRSLVEDWMTTLEARDWRGETLDLHYVNTIFWNVYGTAFKGNEQLIEGFESPRQSFAFATVIEFKDQVKEGWTATMVGPFLETLGQFLSESEVERWRHGVLNSAQRVDLSFYTYFLTADGQALRSSLVYQISRDCKKMLCRGGDALRHSGAY